MPPKYIAARKRKLAAQRKARGFDDTELYNLDARLAEHIAPRLRAFAANVSGYPDASRGMTMARWKAQVNRMAQAWEWVAKDRSGFDVPPKHVERGLDDFRKYLFNLWD